MAIVFFLLAFVCFIFLIIGLVKPRAVIYWGSNTNKTRKKVLLYYAISILIFFVAFVATVPESSSEKKAEVALNGEVNRLKAEEKAKKEEVEKTKTEKTTGLEAEIKAKEAPAKIETDAKTQNETEAKTVIERQTKEIQMEPTQSEGEKTKEIAEAQVAVNVDEKALIWGKAISSFNKMVQSATSFIKSDEPHRSESTQPEGEKTKGKTEAQAAVKVDEKVSIWSKAISSVDKMVQSVTSYIKSDDIFKSEKRQFSEEEIKNLLEMEQVYLTLEDKWFGPDYYKQTLEVFDHIFSGEIYIYSGEMKDNKPNGKGILFTVSDSSLTYGKVLTLLYVGNFKEGVYNGYGVKYKKASSYYNDDYTHKYTRGSVPISLDQLGVSYSEYEGYFKNGNYEGKGKYMEVNEKVENFEPTYLNEYSKTNEKLIKDFENELSDESSTPIHISPMPPLETFVIYEGEFKKNKFNGEGRMFYQNGNIRYEGGFKNGGYSGNGKQFFGSSQLP